MQINPIIKSVINILTVFLFLNFCQCSSPDAVNKIKIKPITPGVINNNIACVKDSNERYAIYIPSKYNADKRWPVIYMLDSHGGGNTPVEKYKDLAEKYGYIIIGSYNSKNGLPIQTSNSIVFSLLEDSKNRLSIDSNKIYLMGFSGGARVAGYYALSNVGITGVIGCGAGLTELKSSLGNLNYFGIAGDEDFNYSEFKTLDKTLDSLKMIHQIVFFNGGHAWPPATVMEEAFLWLDVNAMKDKISPKDNALIKNIQKHFEDSIAVQKSSGDIMKLDKTYKEAINFLNGLTDIGAYQNGLAELEKNPKFIEAEKTDEQIDRTELVLKDKFSKAFETKDLDWWNREVGLLNKEKNKNLLKLNKRVLNHCSIMAYMIGNRALSTGELQWAQKFLQIYVLVDPVNSEAYYLNAQLCMMYNKSDEALAYLEKAVQNKFTDVNRLSTDRVFDPLKQDTKFQKILDEIGKGK